MPTTPALAPLLIDSTADRSIHGRLSGVSMPVRLDVRVDGSVSTRLDGAMLWTHFGVSGPVAMDASRHWLRARLEGRDVQVTASLCPGETFESLEREWVEAVRDWPRSTVLSTLSSQLPASVASALVARLGIADDQTLARLTREDRRRLIRALLEWPLAVVDSRGYNYAEATAGGVPLDEIDPSTMASRLCPELFLVGEILDVDGRIGGFNFQWAGRRRAWPGRHSRDGGPRARHSCSGIERAPRARCGPSHVLCEDQRLECSAADLPRMQRVRSNREHRLAGAVDDRATAEELGRVWTVHAAGDDLAAEEDEHDGRLDRERGFLAPDDGRAHRRLLLEPVGRGALTEGLRRRRVLCRDLT